MKLIILLCLGATQFFMGGALPFESDVEHAVELDQYMKTTPYTREDILAARAQLNLTHYDPDPDEYLTVPQLITKYGYPVEEHFVTTSDHYILRMHRIPPTKPGVVPCKRTVFLMHGLLMSSADWVILGPEKAFAYHLADLGYDVWMGNARGNTQSKNHTRWKPSQSKFWKFSWHEIGTKDVPAMIDYVLKVTKQKALYHVGHSQGTTSFYVMCSELPKYNKKIIAHYSLAPIAYMTHAFSPILRIASKFVKIAEPVAGFLGIREILPHMKIVSWLGNEFCKAGDLTEIICKDTLFLICGFDNSEFNATLLPTLMGHTPAGASVRQMFHYGQLFNSGKFRKYDYFPFNSLHYGPLHPIWPPSYNLRKVKAPVHLYYSQNDWLSHPKDVDKLCSELGNCKSKVLVAERKFNHLDYMLGINARERIYELITEDIVNNSPKLEQLQSLNEEDDEDEDEQYDQDYIGDDDEE